MKQFVALRRSIVRDGHEHLPRPKIVQEVLHIGTKQECQDLIDELAAQPMHFSTEEVFVDFLVAKYEGQKSYNSKQTYKHNGSR